jgi:MEMO1 family protein
MRMSQGNARSIGYGTRPAAVVGSFYPATAQALQEDVRDLLACAGARRRPAVRGVIAPHAGYAFSGPVAAEAFACIAGRAFRRAVIVGPAHYVPFRGIAGPSHASFATPLGPVPVDRAALDALAREGQIIIDDTPHTPEHSVEVELPFLQVALREIPIVPLLVGHAQAGEVASVLERLWDDDTLLVVSSDLSHFEPYEHACHHDALTAERIEALDEAAIGPEDACGHPAIRGALIVAARRRLSVERLDLRNSGDTGAGRASVVGYGAWIFAEHDAR